jgi:hypothetical protein
MTTIPDPFDALTVPGELNAIPWTENDEEGRLFRPLSLGLDDKTLLFQDTIPLDAEISIQQPKL